VVKVIDEDKPRCPASTAHADRDARAQYNSHKPADDDFQSRRSSVSGNLDKEALEDAMEDSPNDDYYPPLPPSPPPPPSLIELQVHVPLQIDPLRTEQRKVLYVQVRASAIQLPLSGFQKSDCYLVDPELGTDLCGADATWRIAT
jgi:hypothetical protein